MDGAPRRGGGVYLCNVFDLAPIRSVENLSTLQFVPDRDGTALLKAPQSSKSAKINWSTEVEVPFLNGQPVSMSLFVQRIDGNDLVSCQGSFMAESFNGTFAPSVTLKPQ